VLPSLALQHLFEEALFPAPSNDVLFNPYADRDDELDVPDAPHIRRANLSNYLGAYLKRPEIVLLAEAPGPRGCRFSGVPLVSESQLADPGFPVHGTPTSRRAEPYREYSARIYWRVLAGEFPRFFTWNAVPLHPHRKGQPLSIRTPTTAEVEHWCTMTARLLDILKPARVLAVGRKAEHALRCIGWPATYVRHPSQGGARIFAGQIGEIFGHGQNA
jgi:hypothetical protein